LLVDLEMFPPKFREKYRLAGVEREIHALISSSHRLGTLREILGRVRGLAFVLRDRFSIDTWGILSGLQAVPRTSSEGIFEASDTLGVLSRLVVDLAALSCMEMENMTRGHGWRFLDLGRRLERGINMTTSLQAAATQGTLLTTVLEPLLEIADSSMTYRRRYFALPHWPGVLDLLLGDETNPRALAFQVQAMAQHVENLPRTALPESAAAEGSNPPPRAPGNETAAVEVARRNLEALSSILRHTDWLELIADDTGEGSSRLAGALTLCATQLRGMSDAITHQYFTHAETRLS